MCMHDLSLLCMQQQRVEKSHMSKIQQCYTVKTCRVLARVLTKHSRGGLYNSGFFAILGASFLAIRDKTLEIEKNSRVFAYSVNAPIDKH